MKSFIKLLFLLAVISTFACSAAFSYEGQKPTVAVITDINHRAGTIYLVTGASTDIIAEDLITQLNRSGQVYAPVLGDSMQKISKNFNLYTKTFFDEYKYNYNIDFVNLKRITQDLNAEYILMVTSGLDVQSNFLKDTWWNKLGIAGMDPVKPTYRLTTLITLIDANNESVMWQTLYKKDISANNYDIGVVQFAPSYAQLSKIKEYSTRVAEHVTPIVNMKINPALEPKKEVGAVEIRKKDVTEDRRIYYPVIHKEKIKMPQFLTPKTKQPGQKEQFIENVNNFTPKKPAFEPEEEINEPEVNYEETQPLSREIQYPDETKPELKPAVNFKKKETLPKYEWNLHNLYDNGTKNNQSFWNRRKLRNIETVNL